MSFSPDPIPDLCPASSISLITGSHFGGKHAYVFHLLDCLLHDKPLPGSRRLFDGRRNPSLPPLRIGWLGVNHASAESEFRALLTHFKQFGMEHLWNHPQFAARGFYIGDAEHHEGKTNACCLTRYALMRAFSGAFGTREGAITPLALPDILIINDLHSLLNASPNNLLNVSRLIQGIRHTLNECNITLLGFVPLAKLKVSEKYRTIASRILGSTAWAANASSIWHIDYEEDDETVMRTGVQTFALDIASNDETEHYPLERSGKLLVPSSLETLADGEASMDVWLAGLAAGVEIRTGSLIQHAAAHALSRSTAMRWAAKQVSDGRLAKIKHGVFSVRPVC